jgi:AraC-like DNA-binding protein
MDVLSDVLGALKLEGQLYFRAELGEPWSVRLPREGNAVRFHLVLQGECWVGVEDEAPIMLAAGDTVLVPHGAAQVLGDRPARAPILLTDLLAATGFDGGGTLRIGVNEGQRRAVLICGLCRFDGSHPLLQALPRRIVLRAADSIGEGWLADALHYMSYEANAGRPGGNAVIGRLADILLIQAVRVELNRSDAATGFLAALKQPAIARALHEIHARPAADWTIASLARAAGISRSRFAESFNTVVGMPPARYLAEWRLEKARRMLLDTSLSVAEIAVRVGYESLPSFTRRFGKRYGIGPGGYRRRPVAEGAAAEGTVASPG